MNYTGEPVNGDGERPFDKHGHPQAGPARGANPNDAKLAGATSCARHRLGARSNVRGEDESPCMVRPSVRRAGREH